VAGGGGRGGEEMLLGEEHHTRDRRCSVLVRRDGGLLSFLRGPTRIPEERVPAASPYY
jgi:hypothetical protein